MSERFWPRVKKGGPDECWPWQGARNREGYGYIKIKGKVVACHRFAYESEKGAIEPGKSVCHTCDNPPCCNPAHLFSGTKFDNMRDAAKKKRLAMPTRKCVEAAIVGRRKWLASKTALAAK